MKNQKPHITFGSKAETLERLRPVLKSAVVLEQVRFDVAEWRADSEPWLKQIAQTFRERRVAVRSSALAEDRAETSGAGRFRSVLDVPTNDAGQLREAIEHVIASYGRDREVQAGDKVFVQPQVTDLAASGVLLTRDPETGAPYLILNIDRRSGRSDSVTSGAQIPFDTFYLTRSVDLATLPADVRACVTLARELEALTHLEALDIEFGLEVSGTLYLFQVRPIAQRARKIKIEDADLAAELEQIRVFLADRMQPHAFLFGHTTVFGTMPDWNPAEMIGIAPHPLALTLYQRLIGRRAWAEARATIGYRDVRWEPLIVSLGGRPYVDVRASLNSFLPAALPPAIGEKLVEHGLERLRQNPRLHDKLEFEVALTCQTFDFEAQRPRLQAAGLSESEIENVRTSLTTLTDEIVRSAYPERMSQGVPLDSLLETLAQLEVRRQNWLNREARTVSALGYRLHHLLEDCEAYGLVPFAILARYAFIAIALLRSLRRIGVFSDEDYAALLHSIPTVASELSRDLALHAANELTTEVFLERYGHLRPSSYDLNSPNYASAPETYLARQAMMAAPPVSLHSQPAVELLQARSEKIRVALEAGGFTASVDQFQEFILRSIPARERAKFIFMKNVDAVLETIAQIGEQLGFTRAEMSFLPIEFIARTATDSPSGRVRENFRARIESHQQRWLLTTGLHLPHLACAPEDVDFFQLEAWTPNFVSNQMIIAPPMLLESGTKPEDLDGRVVLIRAADPGYDWIFSHPIAGLVTQYGGAASHMAIRAAEFDFPAVIGCGEIIFETLRSARLVELDCINKKVRGLP